MSHIVLVRHGETVGQSSIRLYGATDIALSDPGRAQMQRVAATLANQRFDRLVVSPLSRSQESAAIVVGDSGPKPTVVEAFRELNFGDWEGWTLAEAAERDPLNHARYVSRDPTFVYPGGESREGFRGRVQAAIPTVFPPDGGRTLAVLHKGIIKTLMGGLLKLSYVEYSEIECDLASVHELHYADDRWRTVG